MWCGPFYPCAEESIETSFCLTSACPMKNLKDEKKKKGKSLCYLHPTCNARISSKEHPTKTTSKLYLIFSCPTAQTFLHLMWDSWLLLWRLIYHSQICRTRTVTVNGSAVIGCSGQSLADLRYGGGSNGLPPHVTGSWGSHGSWDTYLDYDKLMGISEFLATATGFIDLGQTFLDEPFHHLKS